MRRKDLREQFRRRTGLPENNTKGNNRFNDALNDAYRFLWSDLPDALLSEEVRFLSEPVIKEGGTLEVYQNVTGINDRLVFVRRDAAPVTVIPTDGTVEGRWLEIFDADGNYYLRRIQDVWLDDYTSVNGWSQSPAIHISVDLEWHQNATNLAYRIITIDYPLPPEAQSILEVFYDIDTNAVAPPIPQMRRDQNTYRYYQGYRSEGQPETWARGDFFQLKPPHYTPDAVITGGELNTQKWGYNPSGGAQHNGGGANEPKYGKAGTFSYKVVHVWGRRRRARLTNEGLLEPFYISAESEASAKVSTTWGGGFINVVTPDLDQNHGYNPSTNKPSNHHYGVEKWIFRARHANEAAKGNAYNEYPDADGVYYFWRAIPGYQIEIGDHGNYDPPDKRITIEQVTGHKSIRFDKVPTTSVPVMVRYKRRPPIIQYDNEVPWLPPEASDCLFALVASYLTGDRPGVLNMKSTYYQEYLIHRDRLISQEVMEPGTTMGFADGLSPGGDPIIRLGEIRST
jgi:hypothetical protein|tara:strand:- start:843 stop:2378 length:1536 start_codon:yes stop_codon:yes gene_type:complete